MARDSASKYIPPFFLPSEWCLRNGGQCYSTASDPNPKPESESEVTQAEGEGEDDNLARPLHPEPLGDESAAAAGVSSATSAAILATTLPLLFIR